MCKVEHGGIILTGLKRNIWWRTCPGGTLFLYRLDLPGIEPRPLLMVVLTATCQSYRPPAFMRRARHNAVSAVLQHVHFASWSQSVSAIELKGKPLLFI